METIHGTHLADWAIGGDDDDGAALGDAFGAVNPRAKGMPPLPKDYRSVTAIRGYLVSAWRRIATVQRGFDAADRAVAERLFRATPYKPTAQGTISGMVANGPTGEPGTGDWYELASFLAAEVARRTGEAPIVASPGFAVPAGARYRPAGQARPGMVAAPPAKPAHATTPAQLTAAAEAEASKAAPRGSPAWIAVVAQLIAAWTRWDGEIHPGGHKPRPAAPRAAPPVPVAVDAYKAPVPPSPVPAAALVAPSPESGSMLPPSTGDGAIPWGKVAIVGGIGLAVGGLAAAAAASARK